MGFLFIFSYISAIKRAAYSDSVTGFYVDTFIVYACTPPERQTFSPKMNVRGYVIVYGKVCQ